MQWTRYHLQQHETAMGIHLQRLSDTNLRRDCNQEATSLALRWPGVGAAEPPCGDAGIGIGAAASAAAASCCPSHDAMSPPSQSAGAEDAAAAAPS